VPSEAGGIRRSFTEEPKVNATAVLAPLAKRISGVRNGTSPARDPEFVRRIAGPVAKLTNYFSPEVRGVKNMPANGPVILIGNHSCLFYMPDVWVVAEAIVAWRGVEQPAYAMGYDLLFAVPGVGKFLRRIGALPAAREDAEAALAGGGLLLVYPGGDFEACRPWTERNRVEFGGHQGFVKLALRTGAPVVPVVTHGSHNAVFVLTRGEPLAKAMGLGALRIKVFPLALGPFGLTSMLAPPPPLPSAITVEFLPALDWSRFGPEAADDDGLVSECYEQITGVMQEALSRLQHERPHPVARGMVGLARRALTGKLWQLPSYVCDPLGDKA
jgi:1-acyl-sn-glycerol-3-phosphate acyltransferase